MSSPRNRQRQVERFIVAFQMAVKAMIYDEAGRDDALATLRAELSRVTEFDDCGDPTVATSWWRLTLAAVRTWLDANSDELREALTDPTVGVVDTLAKWMDARLLAPRDAKVASSLAQGGR